MRKKPTLGPLDIAFMEYMNRNCRGRANAMPRKRIEDILEVYIPQDIKDKDRLFRDVYSRQPVCACPQGLFLPTTPEDVAEFKLYLTKKCGPFTAAERVRVVLAYRPELVPVDSQQELLDFDRRQEESSAGAVGMGD